MATATRRQRRYDHRLRNLVCTTRDIHCAIQRGVPRSTARGWLTVSDVPVVTVEALNPALHNSTDGRCTIHPPFTEVLWEQTGAGNARLTIAEDDAVFNRRFVLFAEDVLARLPP